MNANTKATRTMGAALLAIWLSICSSVAGAQTRESASSPAPPQSPAPAEATDDATEPSSEPGAQLAAEPTTDATAPDQTPSDTAPDQTLIADRTADATETRPTPFPPPRDPFRRPKRPRRAPRLWFLNVEFGVAVPLNADERMPDAGVFVSLRSGRRLFQSGSTSFWVGLDVTMNSLRKDDEVVLNPDDAPEAQVTCEDDRGLTLWTLRATLGLEWMWKRFAFRVVGFGGGGFGEYSQLSRVAGTDGNGDPVLECRTEELTAWVPTAGGWLRGGWRFSEKAEAGLILGATAVFSSKKFKYDTPDGPRSMDVLPHIFHAGAYFTHRF